LKAVYLWYRTKISSQDRQFLPSCVGYGNMADPNVRTMPNSKESEMMVLGSMLTSLGALNIAGDALNPEDFYYTEHQVVFHALQDAYRSDKPADIHLIGEELKRQGKLDQAGGVAYLATLAQYAGTSAFIEEYAALVQEKSILRRMVHAAQTIERTAFQEPSDVFAALDAAQAQLFQISQSNQKNSYVALHDLLSGAQTKLPYLKALQERQQEFQEKGPDQSKTTGMPTHFVDLDHMLNGFNKSNLMILGARPSMGKTALAANLAENICFRNHVPVGMFSLEMGSDQLLHRLICSQAQVESEKIQTGSLNSLEYMRIVEAVHRMQKDLFLIDDQPGLKITDLRARARRMKEAHNIGFLIIDYLQLLSGSGTLRSMENRQIEISEISRSLKNLARELDLPILCLAQLSRKIEERQGHRPMMSDLRESGCLTGDTEIQDAETGQIHTIKELAERGEQTPIQVFAVDDQLKLGKHILTKAFYSGEKRVYELKTKSGRTIKATTNHPFLKLEGWTALDQLKRGDRIGLPRQLDSARPAASMAKDELSFLGHLLGDGCILPKQPYHYTTADPINMQIVTDTSDRLFQIKAKVVPQGNWSHVYFPSPVHLTHGVHHPITNWFHQLGIDRVRSYEKKIPAAVFCGTTEDRAFFLHHLWATAGNISQKKIPGRKPNAAIDYASSSPVLAKQVQHLLLTLGIQSSLRASSSNKGYRTMHHVHVEGTHNQQIFLSKVGYAGERGAKIPHLLSNLNQIAQNPNRDVIPKEAWSLYVKQAKDRKNLGWRDICKALDTSYGGSSLFKSGISRERMQRLHSFLKDDALLNLATSGVYWDEISSITELGVEPVYDATVPEVHNFVANGFVVHNSLEQDADIVMFLSRQDYYDPYNKPGQADLIIAKNRHGATGDVRLTFRKEIAQFVNFTPAAAPQAAANNDAAFAAFTPRERDT
jgi:replicative DNA helicase